MSTSGQTVWQMTRDEIISAALRKIGVIGEGVVANATQLSEGQEALNTLIASFQTLGLQLWKRVELPINVVAGQKDYFIGVGQAINVSFPTKVLSAVLNVGTGSEVDVEIRSNYDFNRLPSTASGTPVSVKYQPFVNYGVLSVWPTPDTGTYTITITSQKPLEVFTAGNETADFPQEWHNALIYGLALLLADEYGLPINDKQWYEKQAEKHLNTALSFGGEDTSLTLYPTREW
jgi:hypothetical protein